MKFHEEILMEIKIMDFNVVQVFLRIYPVKSLLQIQAITASIVGRIEVVIAIYRDKMVIC